MDEDVDDVVAFVNDDVVDVDNNDMVDVEDVFY